MIGFIGPVWAGLPEVSLEGLVLLTATRLLWVGSLKVTQEGLQELVDEGLCGADSVGMRWQRPWAGAHLGKPPGGAKVAGGRTLVVEGCFCHRLFSPAILSRALWCACLPAEKRREEDQKRHRAESIGWSQGNNVVINFSCIYVIICPLKSEDGQLLKHVSVEVPTHRSPPMPLVVGSGGLENKTLLGWIFFSDSWSCFTGDSC